jgi:hypothetical protein
MVNVIYVFGTGRWSKEIIKCVSNLKNVKIFIITSKIHIRNWVQKKKLKNVFFLKKLPHNNQSQISKIFIVSLVGKHLSQIKMSIDKKYNRIFVEKPLVKNKKQISLLDKNKKKIYVSRIFSFDEKFKFFLRNIDTSKIKHLKFFWHDPAYEKRRRIIKVQDKTIKYSFDIMPHIANILDLIFKDKKIKPTKFLVNKNKNNESKFNFWIKDINVFCDFSRVSKRIRKIEFTYHDEKFYEFDFSNNKRYLLKITNKKKTLIKRYNSKLNNLKKMIFSFLLEDQKMKLLNYQYSKNFFINYDKILK